MKSNQNANVKKKNAKEMKNPPSKNDPFGSYTGVPLDRQEKPVQDADDL